MPEEISKAEYEKIKGWLDTDLKKSYVMIERNRWWWFISGFIATLIAAIGITWATVKKAIDDTGVPAILSRIQGYENEAKKIVEGLPTLEPRIDALANLNIEVVSTDKGRLGDLPRIAGEPSKYPLPDGIPDTAREILIFAYVRTGSMTNAQEHYYSIYTDKDDQDILGRFVLGLHTYPQNAVSFNSQTFWLPMPSNRIVKAELSGLNVIGDNFVAYLAVLGWR
jgi:hypothetical protein